MGEALLTPQADAPEDRGDTLDATTDGAELDDERASLHDALEASDVVVLLKAAFTTADASLRRLWWPSTRAEPNSKS